MNQIIRSLSFMFYNICIVQYLTSLHLICRGPAHSPRTPRLHYIAKKNETFQGKGRCVIPSGQLVGMVLATSRSHHYFLWKGNHRDPDGDPIYTTKVIEY